MADHSLRPVSLFRRGERARQKSRFAEALAFYRQAQAAYKREKDLEGERDAFIGVGDSLRMLGQFARAKQAYTRAVRLSQFLADPEGLAESQVGVGLSLRAQGNPERALP